MLDTWVITLEISVSFIVGVVVLFLVVRAIRNGEFDDGEKMMQGLLYDNNEDLQDAINQEQKVKKLREEKKLSNKKVKNDI